MAKEKKTIKRIILIILGVIILIGLVFLYKYVIYEPKEDWDNITWVKYQNKTNWLLPHWQVDVPKGWRYGNTTCCSYLGFSFIGWTSDLLSNSLLSEKKGGGWIIELLNITDKNGILSQLSIYRLLERTSDDDIENLQNNSSYQQIKKNNLNIFIEKQQDAIQLEDEPYNLSMNITEVYVDRSAKAYIISGKDKFEITMDYKTNSDPTKVYNAFSHIVNSFEIIE